MSEMTHRILETNGIRIHVAEAGRGPLVVMCHGFPESWYSWRHQLAALAAAGYHAVAPDMRGYGQTDAPGEITAHVSVQDLSHNGRDLSPDLSLGRARGGSLRHSWAQ